MLAESRSLCYWNSPLHCQAKATVQLFLILQISLISLTPSSVFQGFFGENNIRPGFPSCLCNHELYNLEKHKLSRLHFLRYRMRTLKSSFSLNRSPDTGITVGSLSVIILNHLNRQYSNKDVLFPKYITRFPDYAQ